jgi:glycosyltransferase involved in cell wall biosynthesis
MGAGFGLPLVEAARHSLPIIARDIPVFREVAGVHAWYFSGEKPEDLARAVEEWLALRKEGRQPRSDGLPWLTWEDSTRNLLTIPLNEVKAYE